MPEKKVEWTGEQRSAIDLRGRDMLVSAGAGSGKTSVMAERIIDRICDEKDPCDLSEMLIVTFTVKATGELCERIAKGLRRRLKETGDPRIKKTLSNLGSANITTINGFCYSVVRRGFAALGLPASVRIADETENEILTRETMEETLEEFFTDSARYGIDDFPAFAENFINDRDDDLGNKFLGVYNKLLSLPEGVGILEKKAKGLDGITAESFFDSDWGKLIKEKTFELLRYYRGLLSDAVEYFKDDEKTEYNYGVQSADALGLIDSILDAGDPDYEFIRTALTDHVFPPLGRKRLSEDQKTPQLYFFKRQRNEFKDKIVGLKESFYSMPASELERLCRMTAQTVDCLGSFLCVFEKKLDKKKKELGLVSFADCERMSLNLFTDENGQPTPFAEEYRERFREIYIDEYQDTNELQDSIFRAIARPGSRFMVGDVKQSIYVFREAEPALFTGYRDSWKKYEEGDGAKASTLFLSTNFRSTPQIINTVNAVFNVLFPASGRIGYTADDALMVPEDKKEEKNDKVEIVITPYKEDLPEGEEADVCVGIDYIARKIISLIAEGEDPADCAVLVRTRALVGKVAEAFRKYGIAYDAVVKENFFRYPEILLVVSVLRVINNPTSDVYLSSVLSSPMYGLSVDDVTSIRLDGGNAPLWDIVSASDDPRIVRFLRDLDEWREFARKHPSHLIIKKLYDEYSLIGACCKGRSAERAAVVRSNCDSFYEIARRYESGSFKGLYSFLDYISSVSASENGVDVKPPRSGGLVKIMNIHQSKGLEFKNCFIYTGNRGLRNTKDMSDIVFSKRLGFACKVRDRDLPLRYDTPMREAVIRNNFITQSAEELRILYVAMTRAKERLCIVAERSKDAKYPDYYALFGKYMCDTFVYESDRFTDWILSALSGVRDPADWEIITVFNRPEKEGTGTDVAEVPESKADEREALKKRFAEEIREKFAYTYPHVSATSIPAKLSVSALYPEVLDVDNAAVLTDREKSQLAVPEFKRVSEKKGGAFAGTATHLFMQFCDFEALRDKGSEYELKRLREESFLSADAASEVRLDQIDRFADSGLFCEILDSPEVWRERRFNVLLPAAGFSANKEDRSLDGETILVQGVVDCVFRDKSGGLVLVDYKTDSVKGMSDAEAEAMLRERHTRQLGYYKLALEKLTGDRVSRTEIYSFGLGRTVAIDA